MEHSYFHLQKVNGTSFAGVYYFQLLGVAFQLLLRLPPSADPILVAITREMLQKGSTCRGTNLENRSRTVRINGRNVAATPKQLTNAAVTLAIENLFDFTNCADMRSSDDITCRLLNAYDDYAFQGGEPSESQVPSEEIERRAGMGPLGSEEISERHEKMQHESEESSEILKRMEEQMKQQLINETARTERRMAERSLDNADVLDDQGTSQQVEELQNNQSNPSNLSMVQTAEEHSADATSPEKSARIYEYASTARLQAGAASQAGKLIP